MSKATNGRVESATEQVLLSQEENEVVERSKVFDHKGCEALVQMAEKSEARLRDCEAMVLTLDREIAKVETVSSRVLGAGKKDEFFALFQLKNEYQILSNRLQDAIRKNGSAMLTRETGTMGIKSETVKEALDTDVQLRFIKGGKDKSKIVTVSARNAGYYVFGHLALAIKNSLLK